MIEHLVTRRHGAGLDLLFLAGDKMHSYFVTRTAIGVAFPDEEGIGYAVVVGERTFFGNDSYSRGYRILDESRTTSPSDFLGALIALKDRWLAEALYCPKEEFQEHIKRQEGLTYYDRPDHECKAIWPTYQDAATTVTIREQKIDDVEVRRTLDTLMSEFVKNPDNQRPELDGELRPEPRLFAMADLNTQHAAAALQPGMDDPAVAAAIYLAVNGLEKSRPQVEHFSGPAFERKVGTSGY